MAAAATIDRRPGGERAASFADELLDEVVPEELDWRRLVCRYPKTALAVAGVGGYLIGRSRGRAIVAALAAFASARITEQLGELLGEEAP